MFCPQHSLNWRPKRELAGFFFVACLASFSFLPASHSSPYSRWPLALKAAELPLSRVPILPPSLSLVCHVKRLSGRRETMCTNCVTRCGRADPADGLGLDDITALTIHSGWWWSWSATAQLQRRNLGGETKQNHSTDWIGRICMLFAETSPSLSLRVVRTPLSPDIAAFSHFCT